MRRCHLVLFVRSGAGNRCFWGSKRPPPSQSPGDALPLFPVGFGGGKGSNDVFRPQILTIRPKEPRRKASPARRWRIIHEFLLVLRCSLFGRCFLFLIIGFTNFHLGRWHLAVQFCVTAFVGGAFVSISGFTVFIYYGARSTGRPIDGQTSQNVVNYRVLCGLPVDRPARR